MRELAQQFVCAADETWRLQNGKDAECRFFQKIASQGHYQAKGGTRQGYYAIAPNGTLLASANSRSGEAILAMMKRALVAWDALDATRHVLPADTPFEPEHRWEASYPTGGLVFMRYVRDILGSDRRWNRDYAWFTRDEVKELTSLPPRPGATRDWPQRLAARLARFHLVDNVRGQTLPFAAGEIERADLRFTVVRATDDAIDLELTGKTHAVAKGPWLLGKTDWTPTEDFPRTMTTTIFGRARFNRRSQRFVTFSFAALGTRTGRTGNDGRNKESPEPTAMGFAFSLARGDVTLAPTFLEFYPDKWVKRPHDLGYGEHK